jgi:hypothetical protein
MEKSYKFFAHLYDVETLDIVAQKDFIPYDWGYPTVWWEAKEIVSDQIRVPLDDVSSGEYLLAAGAYAPDTEERLPISSEGFDVLSRALILQEVTVP